ARVALPVQASLPEEATAEQLEQCRLTPELSRPTTREPGAELTPQQPTRLQMERSGFGLNDLLGACATAYSESSVPFRAMRAPHSRQCHPPNIASRALAGLRNRGAGLAHRGQDFLGKSAAMMS